ncbi:hypothetical protein PB70LOC_04482 [Pectobacterium versatile]|uniref:hypothetical protein n=1 Tax=Pectobacterium versatile TaxID=2488639 RepID=UPI000CDF14BF|nr:hypothetical protein [Pectobacterium versatile]POY54826.1 hypothetical protein PB70LOC_04482 [Pectobacterium versatile]POY60859.1 hypothetical protein PB69LOC_04482 [Pectobacterium versatile]
MGEKSIANIVEDIELKSQKYGRGCMLPGQASAVVNGKTLTAKSKPHRRGHSGKAFQTFFYIDGFRVARANIEKALYQ